jgi:hypothetical protein
MIFDNPSWPPGQWHIEYNINKDRYIIRTTYEEFIGEIGHTLVAHWIVDTYNYWHKMFKRQ